MYFSPYALPIGAASGWIAARLLRDARRSKDTGITNIFGDWPDGFERETQPWSFWSSVVLAYACGCLLAVAAAILLVGGLVDALREFGLVVGLLT